MLSSRVSWKSLSAQLKAGRPIRRGKSSLCIALLHTLSQLFNVKKSISLYPFKLDPSLKRGGSSTPTADIFYDAESSAASTSSENTLGDWA